MKSKNIFPKNLVAKCDLRIKGESNVTPIELGVEACGFLFSIDMIVHIQM